MTDLQKVEQWLRSFPDFDRLQQFRVDFARRSGENGGLYPGGLQEVSRKTDIFGNVTAGCRYRFGLYFVLEKPAEDADAGAENARWLMDFQNWVQMQSALGQVPRFGSRTVSITARKGALKDGSAEGTGLYSAELIVEFIREF